MPVIATSSSFRSLLICCCLLALPLDTVGIQKGPPSDPAIGLRLARSSRLLLRLKQQGFASAQSPPSPRKPRKVKASTPPQITATLPQLNLPAPAQSRPAFFTDTASPPPPSPASEGGSDNEGGLLAGFGSGGGFTAGHRPPPAQPSPPSTPDAPAPPRRPKNPRKPRAQPPDAPDASPQPPSPPTPPSPPPPRPPPRAVDQGNEFVTPPPRPPTARRRVPLPPSPPVPSPIPSPPPPDIGLNDTMALAILNEHNRLRALSGAAPLTWNPDLAAAAAGWTKNCFFYHSDNGYGENLAAGYFDPVDVVDSWYNEVCSYNFAKPGFSDVTGHYTQVVWQGTRQVGCAVTFCPPPKNIYVGGVNGLPGSMMSCNYWPPGNAGGYATQVQPPSSFPSQCADRGSK